MSEAGEVFVCLMIAVTLLAGIVGWNVYATIEILKSLDLHQKQMDSILNYCQARINNVHDRISGERP